MGYTRTEYPFQMQTLAPMVRAKAIEIAKRLIREGMELKAAIETAIYRARDWYVNGMEAKHS